jgi:hypothetical protein
MCPISKAYAGAGQKNSVAGIAALLVRLLAIILSYA